MSRISNNIFEEGIKILREEGPATLASRIPRTVYARVFPLEYRIAIRLRLQERQGYTVLHDPLDPIYIDPKRVTYSSNARFVPEKYYIGRIVSGDWDKQRVRLENTVTYRGLYDRFVDGCCWEKTEYYEHAKNIIENEGEYLGYTRADEFLESRCQFVDGLFISLKEEGYKSIKDNRPADNQRPWSSRDPTEISIVIDRNGKLLLHDGHHRLILAQFLDIDKVPIHVLVRHEEWQQRREKYTSKVESKTSLHSHPDLEEHI